MDARPDHVAILDHVRAFTGALARLDLDGAFRLCPVREKKRLLTPGSDPKWFAKHLPDALFSHADPLAYDDPRDLDDATRDAWLRSLRHPHSATPKQLGLRIPAEGEGEVLVNLAVGGKYGNLVMRFELANVEGRWALCFDAVDMP